MQKHLPVNYITLVITILNLLVIVLVLHSRYGEREEQGSTNGNGYYVENVDVPHSFTTDVFIPQTISFAGEQAPLHRVDIRESLARELIVNTYLHSQTIQIIKKAPKYFAIIEPILKEEGVPDDFKYLAVIESSLEPLAVSPSGAVGIWQFMKETAQEYQLEIDQDIDERYHIEKSTHAAAKYLKKSYEKFRSWTAAAATYNAGVKMIGQQMELQKKRGYYDLLLGQETERYVFRILALKQIMNHPELYHFQIEESYPIEEAKKIKVNHTIHDLADFATEHQISYKTLKRFNPWLRKNYLKNPRHKVYEIRVPAEPERYK